MVSTNELLSQNRDACKSREEEVHNGKLGGKWLVWTSNIKCIHLAKIGINKSIVYKDKQCRELLLMNKL